MNPEPLPFTPSWARRNGFSDAGLALIWLLMAFILFQFTAGLVAMALIMTRGGITSAADMMSAMETHMDLVFIGNSVGQILFLGLVTLFVARLHSDSELSVRQYVRVHRTLPKYLILSVVLFLAVQPLIWFLGYLNGLLPVPELFTDLQKSQYEMIERFLTEQNSVLPALFNIAVVPAICEEILFRGYLQRSFERSFNTLAAILLSGFLFGLYHVQLQNLLPLATLGILLALLTWVSGSLWPAIIAHFVNNAGAVITLKYFPESMVTEMGTAQAPPIWLLLGSIVLTAGIIYLLLTFQHVRPSKATED